MRRVLRMEEKVYSVFISYCWTSPEHEKWVHDLALRLMETDGIDVKLDKWDLKPGQDKFAFMESMVNDNSIDKVLIICDKGYKEKADNRTGGVGTEAQIITAEIYGETQQEKFVPVIAEHGKEFDSYMPIYLKSRIGIDLSTEEGYEEGYEKLLRTIAERPMYRKPTRGNLPSFLFEEEKSHSRTKNLNKQLKTFILNKPESVKYIIVDFLGQFVKTLNEFKIETNDFKQPYDEQIYNNIKDMQPLRDDYIEFLSLICKDKNNFNIDNIIKLFEEIYCFTEFQELGSSYEIQFDHYKFFIQELFLYTAVILLENSLFEELSLLLNTKFLVKHRNELSYVNFDQFHFYISSLDEYRKKRLNSQFISITAELLIQRSTFDNRSYKNELLDTDLLLYYLSSINNKTTNNETFRVHCWFPTTYIYGEYRKIELLMRLSSKRFFERAKILFNISSKEELQTVIAEFQNPYQRGYNSSFYNIPDIKNYIKPEEICSFA